MVAKELLISYQKKIEKTLQIEIEGLGPKSPLRDACAYALLNGGKRFRPTLVLIMAESLGFGANVMQAAIGVEFFHTASLIADDLPCMDDDDERRDHPSVHCVFGESVALLATYALIAAGYSCLVKNGQLIKNSAYPFADQGDFLTTLAIENVCRNTGIVGATGGQYLDLIPTEPSLEIVLEVLQKKTVTLFEISFVLGWIYGGGDLEKLDFVKKCAFHFGMAFQIADDIGDMEQDLAHGHKMNVANLVGKEKAKEMFQKEIEGVDRLLSELNLEDGPLKALSRLFVL